MKGPTSHKHSPESPAGDVCDTRRVSGASRRVIAAMACLSIAYSTVAPGVARADIVVLRNGDRFEGEVTDIPDSERIRVVIDEGVSFDFPRDEIEEIIARTSPLEQFDERLEALEDDDVDGLVALAVWARNRKLRSRETLAFRRILDVDPHHEGARRALGYVVYRNRWVREKDLRRNPDVVEFESEWISVAERDRRLLVRLREEVAADFEGVDSRNPEIQRYSIARLRAHRDPRMREVLLDYLDHESEAVRVVAVHVLAEAPSPGPEDAIRTAERSALEERIARALHERVLVENDSTARRALLGALSKMGHRGFFELALRTASTDSDPRRRERAAEGVLFALKKVWVPELFAALATQPPGIRERGNPVMRDLLRRIFKRDHEYDAARWQRWWRLNAGRYTDDT